jgi:putative DNA primase/helicase
VLFNLADHLDILEETIRQEQARLVVIDPLSAFLPNRNRNDEGDIRDLLTPLAKLAERCAVVIVGIMHVGKPSTARRTALQSLLGATAFGAIARSVLMAAPVPETDRVALAVVKTNLARKPTAVELSRTDDGGITWHGSSTQDIEALLTGGGSLRRDPRDDAEVLLRELLANGPVPTREVEQAAEEEGISKRSLERVRADMGIIAQQQSGAWYLMLPGSAEAVDEAVAPLPALSPWDDPSPTRACIDCGTPCGTSLRCSD